MRHPLRTTTYLLVSLLVSTMASKADAGPLVLYGFEGTVNHSVCSPFSGTCSTVTVGDPVIGTLYYSYDTEPVDQRPSDSGLGIYQVGGDFVLGYSLTFGAGPGGAVVNSSSTSDLLINQDASTSAGAQDIFNVINYQVPSPLQCPECGSELYLYLNFAPDAFLNDHAQPWLDVSKFDGGTLYLSDYMSYDVWATVDRVWSQPVPEPASVLIVACGLLYAGARGRRLIRRR